MKKIFGIYHKNCIDGTTAAAVLLKKFPHARLFPLSHNYTLDELNKIKQASNKNTAIFIVDFSLRDDKHFELLLSKAREIVVIDHHIGVNERLQKFAQKEQQFQYRFDNAHSGAALTWLYFYGKPLPKTIFYVSDGDTGQWKFKKITFPVTTYLSCHINNPKKMKEHITSNPKKLREIKKQGELLSFYVDGIVKTLLGSLRSTKIKIGKYRIDGYNPPEFLRSHIARKITEKIKKPLVVFNINGNAVRLHFRSTDKINPSALLLAQTLGGNGHRNAAGASVPLKKFVKMIV